MRRLFTARAGRVFTGLLFAGLLFARMAMIAPAKAEEAPPPNEPMQNGQAQNGIAWFNPDVDALTSAQEDTDRVKAYLNAITTMRADFIQIAPNQAVSSGKLLLQRPGRVRFDYDDPSPLLIVGDGKVVNLIDYDLRQVTRWPIKKTPLRPLVSADVVFGEDIDIVGLKRDARAIGVDLVDPRSRRDGTLRLIFSREPFALRRWEVTDPKGEITIIALNNVETNVTFDAGAFAFDDPRPKRRRRPGRR